MKSLLLLLAVAVGCSQAVADEPAKSAPPNSLQAFDASIGKIDRKLDTIIEKSDANTTAVKGLAETIGNANAGHETTQSLLKTLQTDVGMLLDMAAEQATSKLVPTPIPPAGTADDLNTAGPVKSSTPPKLKPEFEFLADDPDFCFECNRHTWLDPEAYYVPPVKGGAVMLSHIPGPTGKHAAPATAATSAQHVTGWRIVCENGTCRRVPIIQQQPVLATPRQARKAARGK
jgi:hypothetical protein